MHEHIHHGGNFRLADAPSGAILAPTLGAAVEPAKVGVATPEPHEDLRAFPALKRMIDRDMWERDLYRNRNTGNIQRISTDPYMASFRTVGMMFHAWQHTGRTPYAGSILGKLLVDPKDIPIPTVRIPGLEADAMPIGQDPKPEPADHERSAPPEGFPTPVQSPEEGPPPLTREQARRLRQQTRNFNNRTLMGGRYGEDA